MLGTLVAVNDVPLPALSCVVIFTGCAWVLARPLCQPPLNVQQMTAQFVTGCARLDLYLSRKILAIAAILLILPPTLVTVQPGSNEALPPFQGTAVFRCALQSALRAQEFQLASGVDRNAASLHEP